jgi:rhamnosyltransferase
VTSRSASSAVFIGWLGKAVTILATFVNVRLLVELIGVEGFAAHAIIFSLLTWLGLLNFGIPAAVQNRIAAMRAHGQSQEALRSDAVGTTFLLAIALQPILLALAFVLRPLLFRDFAFVDAGALWFAFFAMAVSGLTLTFNQMLYAEHRPLWPNLYPTFVALLSLLGLSILRGLGEHSFDVVIVAYFTPYFLGFGIAYAMNRPIVSWRCSAGKALQLIRSARGYALFALLLALSSALDYAVLSRSVVPHEIGKYAFANRAFVGVLSLYLVILATRWAPLAELMHRSAFSQVRSQMARMVMSGFGLAAVCSGVLWVVIDWVASLLSVGEIDDIGNGLMAGWICYLFLRIWTDTFVTVLLGAGQTAIVNRALTAQAVVGVLAQLLLTPTLGSTGAIAGMAIGLVATSGWMLPRHLFRLMKTAPGEKSAAPPADLASLPMMSAAGATKVVAVAVSYNPMAGEIERLLNSVLPQVDLAVVVDNGSLENMRERLPPLPGKLEILSLDENYGIATALNRGIAWARAQNATHVLLLDQDSELAPDAVSRLLDVSVRLESNGVKVGAVGARYYDPRQDNPTPFIRVRGLRLERFHSDSPDAIFPVDYLITSGSLIPLASLDAVGGMDESLFIDYVDIEWGIRANARGYQSYGVCGAMMHHNLGEAPIRFWGRNLPLHSALRHYYHFRNAVALYRRGFVPLNWKLVDGYRLVLKFCFYSVFAKPRLQHIYLMSLGIWHGLTGRSGPR